MITIADIKEKKGNKPVNYKEYSFKSGDVTIDDEGKKVSGYLAVFGNKDDDDDILIKGCFAKSIRERGPQSATSRKIAHLWQHKMDDPLGKYSVLREDDFGLYFEANYDDIPSADRAIKQLKSGTLNQFSIGYQYIWDQCEYDSNLQAWICKELNLFEGSVVTLGANEMTYYSGMKSSQKKEAIEELLKETENFIKGLPEHKQYAARQIMAKNISLAESKKKKDEQSTLENDQTDDINLKCVKDAIGNLTDGMDICDDYADEIDNDDLLTSLKCMKESHAGHLSTMKAHAFDIMEGKKSLNTSGAGTGKPPQSEKPTAEKLFNHLTFSK
jgi:HK97 family phage prohead protease